MKKSANAFTLGTERFKETVL